MGRDGPGPPKLWAYINPSGSAPSSCIIGAGRIIRIGPVAKRLTNCEGSVGRAVVEYDCGRIGLVDRETFSAMEVEEWTVGRIVCDSDRALCGAISGRLGSGASAIDLYGGAEWTGSIRATFFGEIFLGDGCRLVLACAG